MEWRLFVNSHDPDGEKWKWLTEHHRIHDHPEDYETQKRWRLRARFREIGIGFREIGIAVPDVFHRDKIATKKKQRHWIPDRSLG